jgi:beta-lactamase superfamily II metal-dependent hydrolase
MPGASFAQLSRAIAAMWKKAGSKTKSAVRKMMRSPRKARKMRVSKKRAMKKSGSPRKARKDKGTKGRKANAYAMFVKKYFAAKRAALGGDAKPKMVMKALGHDWKQGVRHY